MGNQAGVRSDQAMWTAHLSNVHRQSQTACCCTPGVLAAPAAAPCCAANMKAHCCLSLAPKSCSNSFSCSKRHMAALT